MFSSNFYRMSIYARVVLGVIIPSVCLSHVWIVRRINDALWIF